MSDALLPKEWGYPQHDDGSHDGSDQLADDAAQLDIQQIKQVAAGKTADDAKDKVPQKTTALAHQLIGYETCQNTQDNCSNKSHNQKF